MIPNKGSINVGPPPDGNLAPIETSLSSFFQKSLGIGILDDETKVSRF